MAGIYHEKSLPVLLSESAEADKTLIIICNTKQTHNSIQNLSLANKNGLKYLVAL